MHKSVFKDRITHTEIKNLVTFLSYHLNYIPYEIPKVKIAKTAKHFAKLWYQYETVTDEWINEINTNIDAFYDHINKVIVFQGFAYVDRIEIPDVYIIPMATVIHELIHFFQVESGGYGSYQFLYEGTNEFLSAFLTGDFTIDYPKEMVHAFNLIMECNYHDFYSAVHWIKKFTVHSNKNMFTHRMLKNSPLYSKYRPSNLLRKIDDGNLNKIDNPEVVQSLKKYGLAKIRNLINKNRQLIIY